MKAFKAASPPDSNINSGTCNSYAHYHANIHGSLCDYVRKLRGGSPLMADYSVVPKTPLHYDGTCAPSVAYDEQELFSLTSMPQDRSVMYGFERTTGGGKWTYNKRSPYSNDYLKKGETIFEFDGGQKPVAGLYRTSEGNCLMPTLGQHTEVRLYGMDGHLIRTQYIDIASNQEYIHLSGDEIATGVYIAELNGGESPIRFKIPMFR